MHEELGALSSPGAATRLEELRALVAEHEREKTLKTDGYHELSLIGLKCCEKWPEEASASVLQAASTIIFSARVWDARAAE